VLDLEWLKLPAQGHVCAAFGVGTEILLEAWVAGGEADQGLGLAAGRCAFMDTSFRCLRRIAVCGAVRTCGQGRGCVHECGSSWHLVLAFVPQSCATAAQPCTAILYCHPVPPSCTAILYCNPVPPSCTATLYCTQARRERVRHDSACAEQQQADTLQDDQGRHHQQQHTDPAWALATCHVSSRRVVAVSLDGAGERGKDCCHHQQQHTGAAWAPASFHVSV
jgi:hypothetical protein